MEWLIILFPLFILLAFKLIAKCKTRSTIKLPPGPLPLPILGNLFALGHKPHESLAKLAMTHGPIMTLQLGQLTTIVFSSSTMAKQVLQKHDLALSSRTIMDAICVHGHEHASFAMLPVVSSVWRKHRKVSNLYLFANNRLDANQQVRQRKVQQLVDFVSENIGKPIDIGKAVFKTTLDSLSNTVFSVDFSDDSTNFRELTRKIMEYLGKPNLADYFPLLRRIDPQRIRHRSSASFGEVFDLFDRMVIERSNSRKRQGFAPSNDMLDTILDICDSNNEEFDKNHIKHLFMELFTAGTDTTSSTLEWAMTELLCNPNTLSKAHVEMMNIVGKGNAVQESDIVRLPYLRAIIKETMRLHPPTPLLLPRKANEDVEIEGYIVPKGSQVLVNVWAIGRDPSIWENPNTFSPERFLTSEIDVRGQDFELIPFGGGRRICPGLPLAIRMMHLMLGSLIHKFDWKHDDEVTSKTINMDEKFGLTLQKAQPLRAIPMPI